MGTGTGGGGVTVWVGVDGMWGTTIAILILKRSLYTSFYMVYVNIHDINIYIHLCHVYEYITYIH